MSIRKALSGNSGLSIFHRWVQIRQFHNQVFMLNYETLDREFEGRHQVGSYGETWLWELRGLHIETNFLTFSIGSQIQGMQRLIETSRTPQKREPFNFDLGGGHEACSWGRRWLCMPRYIRSNSIFWSFRKIKILMRGKNHLFDLSKVFHNFQVFGRGQNRW